MVQCSGPPLVCTTTWPPGRKLRTSYRAPGPTPSMSTCPSTTSSDVDGIHHPTSAGALGTASDPAGAASGGGGRGGLGGGGGGGAGRRPGRGDLLGLHPGRRRSGAGQVGLVGHQAPGRHPEQGQSSQDRPDPPAAEGAPLGGGGLRGRPRSRRRRPSAPVPASSNAPSAPAANHGTSLAGGVAARPPEPASTPDTDPPSAW